MSPAVDWDTGASSYTNVGYAGADRAFLWQPIHIPQLLRADLQSADQYVLPSNLANVGNSVNEIASNQASHCTCARSPPARVFAIEFTFQERCYALPTRNGLILP